MSEYHLPGAGKRRKSTAWLDRQPRPCPRCYAPMRLVGKHWECDKHGQPASSRSL